MQIKRHGTSWHLDIKNSDDLFEAINVDPALWVVTSAPISSFSLEQKFLNYLCLTNNSRIIFNDLIQEIQWLKNLYVEYSAVNISSDLFDLASINPNTEDGQKIALAFNFIISKIDSDYISLDCTREFLKEITNNSVSENGIVIPGVAVSAELKKYIELAINVTKGVTHPNGAQGINAELLEKFQLTLANYVGWKNQMNDAIEAGNKNDLLPFGANTEIYYQKFIVLKNKVTQFFAQCKGLTFSKLVSDKVEFLSDINFSEINWQDPVKMQEFLQKSPLAVPNDLAKLAYKDQSKINPYYYSFMNELLDIILNETTITVNDIITEENWKQICDLFSAYDKWYKSNPSNTLDAVTLEDIKEYQKEEYAQAVKTLIGQSAKTAEKLVCITLLEKAILYQKYILPFVRNFIGLTELYHPERKALFEKGNLIMGGKHFNFAIDVENIANHKSIATKSNIFILYLDIIKPDKTKFNVAVPVTAGTKDGLIQGKRGVFIDIKGNKYDAIVADLVTNPISLKEAIIEPFLKVKDIFSKKIDADATQSENKLTKSTTDAISNQNSDSKSWFYKPNGNMNTGAILMGGGVAIAALGSSLTYIINTIASSSVLNILITICLILFAFIAPILISGVFKLRRRDLTPILEGSGWAINIRMRLTRKICKVFTKKSKWPKGTKRR